LNLKKEEFGHTVEIGWNTVRIDQNTVGINTNTVQITINTVRSPVSNGKRAFALSWSWVFNGFELREEEFGHTVGIGWNTVRIGRNTVGINTNTV